MVGHDCDEWVDEGVEVMEVEKQVVFKKKKEVAAKSVGRTSTSTPAFKKPTAKVPTPR